MDRRSDSAPRGHIAELDGIRAVSILLVLAAHTLPLGPKAWGANAAAGLMGMSLFFCLSGFLITSFLLRSQDVLDFLARRLTRIVPGVALYLGVLALLGLPLEALLLNLAFVSNYTVAGLHGGPVGHLWSLSLEMQFYVAIGLAVLALGRRALWLIPPICLAITIVRIRAGAVVDIATHLRVDEILVGGCLALAVPVVGAHARLLTWIRRYAAWYLAIVATLWFFSSHEVGGALGYLRPYLAGTLVGLLVFGGWPPLRVLLAQPVMRYIAAISYALYIWHPLMIHGWMNEGTSLERYLLKRPMSFAATWAAAHASTFLWERHWTEALRRRWAKGPRPNQTAAGMAASSSSLPL